MRFSPFAVALSLLLLAMHAYAASPLQMFLAYSFEPDASVSYSSLLCDGDYYIVISGGQETYVVDGSNGSTVKDISRLTDLLKQDAQNRASYESKIASAKAFPSLVNAAKGANEAKCLQYIGDDAEHPCTDRQSCLVSCFSVPQCEIIVQSDGFLEAAMEWNLKRKEYSSVLGAYSDGLEAIRFDPSSIEGKISLLSNLSSLSANMSQNSIFLTRNDTMCSGKNNTRRCYEYCPQIDYSDDLILAQSQNLAGLKTALFAISGQGARAEAIINRSMENDAYLSSRGRDYEDFRLRMKNDIRNLKAESIVLAKTVKDPQVAPMILQLENISAQAKNYSDSGYYKKALAMRPSFESLSKATSDRIDSDNAQYVSLSLEMENVSEKAKSSAWLIGNQSAGAYLKKLASIKANYSAPLTLPKLSAAAAELSVLSAALASEIASRAVQAGNASKPPPPPVPPVPPQPVVIPDFVWVAAIVLAAAFIYALMLRFSRRTPPVAPLQPPPTQ